MSSMTKGNSVLLPVESTNKWHFFFKDKNFVDFSDGSPRMDKSTILPLAQQIYDSLTGAGLTYMQSWMVIHFAQSALEEKRNKTVL